MGSSASTTAGRRRSASRRAGTQSGGGTRRSRPASRSSAKAKQATTSKRARKPTPRKSSKPSSRRGRDSSRLVRALAVLLALAAALGAGYFLWLRDSPLAAVAEVNVEGVETGDRAQVTTALTRAGEGMTVLNVDHDRLEAIAERFATVESVSAETSLFSRTLAISVTERPPAVVARSEGEETAVAADGTVLPGVETEARLPRIDVRRVPGQGRLGGPALDRALVAATAPEPLAPLIRRVGASGERGIEVRMRGGIELRFGTAGNAEGKWAAAAAVLADPQLESVAYVDVRVPQRPAVGGAEPLAALSPVGEPPQPAG